MSNDGRPHIALRLATALLGLFVAACDGAPRPAPVTTPGADGFPREVVSMGGRSVVVPARPKRIVPTNAAAADFVLAVLGEEGRGRIAALTPETIEYSMLATQLAPWSVVRAGAHSAELILAAAPDLVLDADWQDGGTRSMVMRAGVPVVTLPTVATIDDLWLNFEIVGRATGEEERANEALRELRARATATKARGERRTGTVLFYANLGSGGSVAGAGTTSHIMLELAGLTNAAAGRNGHFECGHEQLIVLAPDWIVVGASGAGSASSSRRILETDSALQVVSAVATGRIVDMPRTLLTSSSQTLVDAAEALLDELDRRDPPTAPR